MPMTVDEARAVVAAIKAGRSFATRYAEQSWGVDYHGDGVFRRWSSDYAADQHSEELLDESQVISLFQGYSLKTIAPSLR